MPPAVKLSSFVSEFLLRDAQEQLKKQNDRLKILNEIATLTVGSLSPKDLCDRLVDTIQRVMHCDAFFVNTYFPENDLVERLRGYDTIDGKIQYVEPASQSSTPSTLTRELLKTHKPRLIHRKPDQETEEGLARFGDKDRPSASLLFVPLVLGDRAIGIISVQSYTYNAYSDEDVDMLVAIAKQLSPALEASFLSMQLVDNEEEMRDFGEKLASLVEVTAILSVTDSMEDLAKKAVELAVPA